MQAGINASSQGESILVQLMHIMTQLICTNRSSLPRQLSHSPSEFITDGPLISTPADVIHKIVEEPGIDVL